MYEELTARQLGRLISSSRRRWRTIKDLHITEGATLRYVPRRGGGKRREGRVSRISSDGLVYVEGVEDPLYPHQIVGVGEFGDE